MMFSAAALCSEATAQQAQPLGLTPVPESLDAIEQLRVLLLGADYQTLSDLRHQLLDRERYSVHVADVISEALTLRGQQDNSLSDALSATIETAMSRSVEENPARLANALYPVMGPAIRKSIQEALHQALTTFNQLLEHSLSLRSLAWRFTAWRTGRSYAEVVLLKTLAYQVEQVFLIHRESGLLLQHVVSPNAILKDPELISSMMIAVQDFVRDSFNVAGDSGLKNLQLDELTVLFNQGPYAVVAAVVRGNSPASLNNVLAETNEQIHRQSAYFLKTFQGNSQPFKTALPLLERCLKTHLQVAKRFPWLAFCAFLTLSSAISWWGYQYYQRAITANAALQALRTEPGLVVVAIEKTDDGYLYELLKDPQAREPLTVIQAMQAADLKLQVAIKPYLAMEPTFVLARAKQALQAASNVQLELKDKALIVSGISDTAWKQKLEQTWHFIQGIESLDISLLKVEDRVTAKLHERLQLLALQIEALRFNFLSGSSVVGNAEAHRQQIVPLILELFSVARSAGKMPQVSISGAADETGTEATNERLAKERALAMRDYLIENGIPAAVIAVPKPDNGRRDERSIHYQVDLF